MFAPKCKKCDLPIEGEYIQAADREWHMNCFTCKICQVTLTGLYFEHKGDVYCEDHRQK